jgi:hypothetical protein
MKRILPSVLAVLFLLGFSGCGKELNDENFADFWVEYSAAKGDAAQEKVMDSYGWTKEQMDIYFEELKGNEERADRLIDTIAEENEQSASTLEYTLFPDRMYIELSRDLYGDF